MKYIKALYDTLDTGKPWCILGTGASTSVFPLDVLDGFYVLGLNQAWKVRKVDISITVHPDLNLPSLSELKTGVGGTWLIGNHRKAKTLLDEERWKWAKENAFFFEYDFKKNTAPPQDPSNAGRDTALMHSRIDNYLYLWSSISQAAICFLSHTSLRYIYMVGCDGVSLNGKHHGHQQHTRWKGVDPNHRYAQYREGLMEVRRACANKGKYILTITPFVSIADPEGDYKDLCDLLEVTSQGPELDLPVAHDRRKLTLLSKLKAKLVGRL